MILIIYRVKSIFELSKIVVIFYSYGMLTAGIFLFLQINQQGSLYLSIDDFKVKYLLISVLAIFILMDRLIAYIKERKILNKYIYPVEIILSDTRIKLEAFFDTGNELREPVTNLPVVIVERDLLIKFNLAEEDIFHIPYRLVDGSKGNFDGFKADLVKIYLDKSILEKEAMVVFSDSQLSKTEDFKGLLSRGIML